MVDYALIKTNLKSILNTANTTTAAFDLSANLSRRVQKVISIHPQRISQQPSWYPYVSMFVDSKTIEATSIAINQSNAKRACVVELKVVGGFWNAKINDKTKDAADDDCELLMENIEEVIRRNPTLDGACLWQMPSGVTFHNRAMDEESALRIGIMSLKITVYS